MFFAQRKRGNSLSRNTSRDHPLHESVRIQRPFDATDTTNGHAVLSRDIRVGAGSTSNSQCFHSRDLQSFLCVRKPTLPSTINHIFLSRTEKQMRRADAQGSVTMMKDKKTLGNRTKAESVSVTMSIQLSSANFHFPVFV